MKPFNGVSKVSMEQSRFWPVGLEPFLLAVYRMMCKALILEYYRQ